MYKHGIVNKKIKPRFRAALLLHKGALAPGDVWTPYSASQSQSRFMAPEPTDW